MGPKHYVPFLSKHFLERGSGLKADKIAGYGYRYGDFSFPSPKSAGTRTSPPILSTGVSGTAAGARVPSTSALCRNSSLSSYFPLDTTPLSIRISSTKADSGTTNISGSPTPSASVTSYGTVSGAPYMTYNSSVSGGYPTYDPTHGPYPFPSSFSRCTSYPSGTIGTAGSTGLASAPSSFGTSGKLTYTAPTGIPKEYFYHHKKPKRNALYGGGYGYQA